MVQLAASSSDDDSPAPPLGTTLMIGASQRAKMGPPLIELLLPAAELGHGRLLLGRESRLCAGSLERIARRLLHPLRWSAGRGFSRNGLHSDSALVSGDPTHTR